MTVNMFTTPNHVLMHGDTHVSHWFGAVTNVHAHADGSHPHVEFECENHVRLEFTAEFLRDLIRRGSEALLMLPFRVDDIHDYIGGD